MERRDGRTRNRKLFASIALLVVLTVLGIPTLHSAMTTRSYSDVGVHNILLVPTGFSEIGFPVYRGDVVSLRFRTENASFEVGVCLGASLTKCFGSETLYNSTGETGGSFRYVVPRDGSMEILWRPLAPGRTAFDYEVRIIPNPTGLSLAPLFG